MQCTAARAATFPPLEVFDIGFSGARKGFMQSAKPGRPDRAAAARVNVVPAARTRSHTRNVVRPCLAIILIRPKSPAIGGERQVFRQLDRQIEIRLRPDNRRVLDFLNNVVNPLDNFVHLSTAARGPPRGVRGSYAACGHPQPEVIDRARRARKRSQQYNPHQGRPE